LKDQVLALATARGVSVSELGVAALQDLLDTQERPERLVLDRLWRLERLVETFVRVFLTLTPDPGQGSDLDRQVAAQRGLERWGHFQAVLAQEEGR
jgi:hypothetical protein